MMQSERASSQELPARRPHGPGCVTGPPRGSYAAADPGLSRRRRRAEPCCAQLPQDAAVKALQATDLVTQAAAVFGSPAVGSAWLTKEHPSLHGQTPLQRARTPWGMGKVLSMLVALRYGGVA